MNTLPRITHAAPTASEVDAVANLIATAFVDLPPAVWLVPDPDARPGVLAKNFRLFVEQAFQIGRVDVLEDRSAAAVWFYRESPNPPPHNYDKRLSTACGPYTERFRTLDALFDEHHPAGPHHHLAFLAVHPTLQGTGRGSALLKEHQARLDHYRMPAYLEASSTASRDFYLRHGYIQAQPFTLPDGPPFFPMTRPGQASPQQP